MILRRAVRGLGEERPIEGLAGPDLRAWILELRSTLSPISVAGYVRTLKVFGNWLAAEELAQAAALRTLRKPRVPDKLVEPISDDAMRRLLAVADVRDRAILLILLDCGLRVSEAAGLRLGDLRPDGTLKVMGKGAKERIVPVGGTARTAMSATWVSAVPARPTSRSSSVDAARSTGGGCSGSSSASKAAPTSPGDAARTRCATPSPGATSSTAVTYSASRGSSATRRSTWSSATSPSRTSTSSRAIAWRHRRIGSWAGGGGGRWCGMLSVPATGVVDVRPSRV